MVLLERLTERQPYIDIYSPGSGERLGRIPAMAKEDIDEFIKTAHKAQRRWAEVNAADRAALLHRWAGKLLRMKEELAPLIMREVGKPLSSARSEVERTAELIQFTAEDGVRITGELSRGDSFPSGKPNKIALAERVPLGVVLAISPFNYPVNLAASKIAPALIAGNAVVFKPATQGALSGIKMIDALVDAGAPPELVQIITGRGADIGDYVVTHSGIDMISFTGGTRTGQSISRKASMIPVALEMGGKDPAIVLEDADMETAAKEIISGAFSYSGQRCTAVKRVLVMEPVADRLVNKLKQKIEALKTGPAEEEATVVPLIDERSANFVQSLIGDALHKGASLVTGGGRTGNLIHPTLLDHVTEHMNVAWEEQFGPVLPVIRVNDIRDAVRLANASEYGLQASIFTASLERAFSLAQKLEVGTVQVNGRPERGPDHFPFLGVKNSGLGVQGVRKSIESMMREKVTILNL